MFVAEGEELPIYVHKSFGVRCAQTSLPSLGTYLVTVL